MQLGEECRDCLYRSQSARVLNEPDSEKKERFLREIRQLTKTYPSESASPLLMRAIDRKHREIFGHSLDYSEEKVHFNRLFLDMEEKIEDEIFHAKEPLKRAIQYARVGNLIDFAKLTAVDENQVNRLIDIADRQNVEEDVYLRLLNDLKEARRLVYLLDNCGEIVFDKILIQTIRRYYPDIFITAVVRGKEIINDVTKKDSVQVGLDRIVEVIDNGTDIPGTYLKEIGKECREKMEKADLILSKGLGNFETLSGCGMNIYYMFLCKCRYFADKFHLKQWESVLTNERLLSF